MVTLKLMTILNEIEIDIFPKNIWWVHFQDEGYDYDVFVRARTEEEAVNIGESFIEFDPEDEEDELRCTIIVNLVKNPTNEDEIQGLDMFQRIKNRNFIKGKTKGILFSKSS